MVLRHVTVQDISGFQHLEALGALISLAQLMLRFEVRFHVISFVGNVGFILKAEGADKFPIVRTDSMSLHKVCMATRSRDASQANATIQQRLNKHHSSICGCSEHFWF